MKITLKTFVLSLHTNKMHVKVKQTGLSEIIWNDGTCNDLQFAYTIDRSWRDSMCWNLVVNRKVRTNKMRNPEEILSSFCVKHSKTEQK